MPLAQGNNTPTRPRIEPGSPDPESDALTTRPVRPDGQATDVVTFDSKGIGVRCVVCDTVDHQMNLFSVHNVAK